jgi:hypothetical protein
MSTKSTNNLSTRGNPGTSLHPEEANTEFVLAAAVFAALRL